MAAQVWSASESPAAGRAAQSEVHFCTPSGCTTSIGIIQTGNRFFCGLFKEKWLHAWSCFIMNKLSSESINVYGEANSQAFIMPGLKYLVYFCKGPMPFDDGDDRVKDSPYVCTLRCARGTVPGIILTDEDLEFPHLTKEELDVLKEQKAAQCYIYKDLVFVRLAPVHLSVRLPYCKELTYRIKYNRQQCVDLLSVRVRNLARRLLEPCHKNSIISMHALTVFHGQFQTPNMNEEVFIMPGLRYLIWFPGGVCKLDCAYGTDRTSTNVTWADRPVQDLSKQERNVLKYHRPERCSEYDDFVFLTFKPLFVSERLPCCKRLVYTYHWNQRLCVRMLMIKARKVLLRNRLLEPFRLALAMAQHPRLGVDSLLSMLESEALRKVAWLL